MKNNAFIIVFALMIVCVMVLSGCGAETYAATIYEAADPVTEYNDTDNYPSAVKICGKEYVTTFDSYIISELTGEKIYNLRVEGSKNGVIKVDKSGEPVAAFNIEIAKIKGDLKALSDEKIETEVKKALDSIIDFSVYNHFSLLKNDMTVLLIWQVKKDLLVNIKAEVLIDNDGNILSFSKTNAYFDESAESFISNGKRDKLIKDALEKKYNNIEFKEISISEEKLSLYRSEKSLICTVNAIDIQGFSYVEVIVIN